MRLVPAARTAPALSGKGRDEGCFGSLSHVQGAS
jgi:hypothetical protein